MRFAAFAFLGITIACGICRAEEKETGFKPIFDGKTLNGWKGDSAIWRVENGAIVGEWADKEPLKKNAFLVWDRGEVDDFELRLKFRLTGSDSANSGIQFRSSERDDGHLVGYQADIDRSGQYVGMLYDEEGRGILARRGEKTVVTESGEKQPESFADTAELLKKINRDDWNDYSIRAQGNQITLKINGEVTAELIDNDPNGLDRIGKLALQVHSGPAMKVEFKDIRLKRLPLQDGWKKVVFVAGRPSHAYFAHEHNGGCLLLAKSLDAAQRDQNLKVISTVYLNGWPADVTAFDNADTVVAYCDGGANHFLNPHLEEFDKDISARGVGLVCLHYGVETTKGKAGDHFLKWIGGYFEPHWSVNPHWTARFTSFPDHPISRGVQPFEINDEWYYHMRFVPDMKGVTPILTDLPPSESLSRPDGPHSGNPAVREAVLVRKEPQHVAWAYNREDGKGRGFGFTGGHNHVNWQHDDFRKVVLNAIVWTAHGEVPEEGVESPTPTKEEMMENMDSPPPPNFEFKPVLRKSTVAPRPAKPVTATGGAVSPLFSSPIVRSSTPGHAVEINVDITGAKALFLEVNHAGDGFSFDWADWIAPRLLVDPADPSKGELKLTSLKWKSATQDWGQTRVNQNAGGGPLIVAGLLVEDGIGTHANSLIEFELPKDHQYTRFVAKGALDDGGVSQNAQGPSVQFRVFTQRPDPATLAAARALPGEASHEASDSLQQLQVDTGLKVELFASEPMMTNPSSIDIDHKGRVWVCEGVNYRHFANKDLIGDHGPDRILVLEDTDGDGKADKSTVFYSGSDVDAAHGILVLPTADGKGTRALISALDKIFYLIDDDGDLKADRKEILFSGIQGSHHDHGVHAAHFGPDGKLYFNFGNEGKQIRDKDGNPIIDKAGNEVKADRKPYQEGMVFRCNLDGSEFETLGWNFRNNWEACVDSFGTIWQSDNDDDGNRGVRVNYVMEFGNFGYKDELTGASWQTPRTNWEKEIPLRHWHLNDPGVVPNLVQTGAGAPTGICLYEGDLLPARFRGAPIHCDAGANACRASVLTARGAGYVAEIVEVLGNSRNHWFRPSDVCVAPDGSLIVADWYDPTIGGHRMMDIARGRLYRIIPPTASRYVVPDIDVSTPQGAVAALHSPNMATRYLAFSALMAMGPDAEAPLLEMRKSSDSVMQARALWLLGKLPLKHSHRLEHLRAGLSDSNEMIRVAAIRLLRQLMDQVAFEEIRDAIRIDDPSPAVRREMLIALSELNPEWIPESKRDGFIGASWSRLAQQYDGEDRWMLEALGIGARGHWDECLAAWKESVGDQWKSTKAGRDLVWRSRARATPGLLVELIQSPATPEDEIPRYMRAFDFQQGSERKEALERLAFSQPKSDSERTRFVQMEALTRLDPAEVINDPDKQAQIEKILEANRGTPLFIKIVSRFQLQKYYGDLLALAQSDPTSQGAADAIKALLDRNQNGLILQSLFSGDRETVEKTFAALVTAGDRRLFDDLIKLIRDEAKPLEIRQGAVRALASSAAGAQQLLAIVQKGEYPQDLKQAVAAALTTVSFPPVRNAALALFPPPPGKDSAPLPPIGELVQRVGNVDNGKITFNTVGTCNKCHQVNGIGQDVGPNLSEIGKKLGKAALYEAILFPSAAISHGYENWLVLTEDGQIYTGLLVSESDEEVKIKDDKGIVRTIPTSQIEERKKQPTSLMPSDLQRLMTTEELVDLVEYLTTLKERRL